MKRVKISDSHDIIWNQNGENCIDLNLTSTIKLAQSQFKIVHSDIKIDLDEDVLGIPFINKNKLCNSYYDLYYPEGSFKLTRDSNKISIAIKNKINHEILLTGYLCSIKFITSQFYNLMKKHDGSDKGLRSSLINIKKYE
jgi:hypothetical protein